MVGKKEPGWNYFWCRNVIDVGTEAVKKIHSFLFSEKKEQKKVFLKDFPDVWWIQNLHSSSRKINKCSEIAGSTFLPNNLFKATSNFPKLLCIQPPLKMLPCYSPPVFFSFCLENFPNKTLCIDAKLELTCKSFLFRLNYMHFNK